MLRLLIGCWLLSLSITDIFSQTTGVDSLKSVIASLPDDTTRLDALNKLVSYFRERNNFEGLIYGTEAIALAERLHNQSGLALALENVGWLQYRRGAYSDAFELSARALKINEELNNQVAIARCLNNVAAVNYERRQYADAIAGFKRAKEISFALNDIQTAVRSLNNISFSFLAQEQLDSATWYVDEAIKNSPDSNSYQFAFSLRLLGDIAMKRGDTKMALDYYNECLLNSERNLNYSVKASTLHRIGKAHFLSENYSKALSTLQENLKIAQAFGYPDELERTHKLLSDVYEKTGQSALALRHLQEFVLLRDSLNNQRNSEQLSLAEARFQSELKQSRIDLLTKEAELKSKEINQQLAWGYFYIGVIVFSLILLIVVIRNNKRIRHMNEELQEKNENIILKSQQLQSLVLTKDKLISVISHDLRSPLGGLQGILNLFGKEQITADEMKTLAGKINQRLSILNNDLDNLLQWTRSQLHGLQVNKVPVNLQSIVSDILSVFQDHLKAKEIMITNEVDTDSVVLADSNHVKIIIRNIISNAIKFTSRGGRITIKSSTSSNVIILSISDNGVGMTREEVENLFNPVSHFSKPGTGLEKGLGVGLLLVKEFLEKNNASISVESQPGKGTTFLLTFQQANDQILPV